ncbi:hypothetical protein ACXYMX_08625 [Sporosarcina sp. CAU 1771]
MKIIPNQPASRIPKSSEPASVRQDTVKENERSNNKQIDKYIPSNKEQSVVYEKPTYKVDTNTINRLKAESEKAYEHLRNLVHELLERQGLKFNDVASEDKEFFVDDQSRLEAQQAIGEGGAYSPEMVSDRIVEFANAISGGDKSKFDQLKNAIEDGFKEAKEMLGGVLPDISQKTYDLVMEKLNEWKES